MAIKRLLQVSAPYLWDFQKQSFVRNPHKPIASLYIGTEMELYEELEPMMWAFVSGVDEDKIHANTMTRDERVRVERAIKILQDTPLYLEDEENYDISFLSHTIEHYKTEYNIGLVVIDYLELTSALTSEFTQTTRGMGVREDQVLLNLSTNIKNMAKRYDIAMVGFTQTTDLARSEGVRDQRAVKGARSLPNKCDLGMVSFAPTRKELELLEDLIEKVGINNYRSVPNICYSVYKNRGGKFKNIKIWGYQNLGTMEYVDLFCTDESYAPINVDKTFLIPNMQQDDEEVIEDFAEEVSTEDINYSIDEATGEIIVVEDDVEAEDLDAPLSDDDYLEFQRAGEQELIAEYNEQVIAQHEGYDVEFAYDEDGYIYVVEQQVDDNPFADLPIIDDEDLPTFEESTTVLGKPKKSVKF